MSQWYEIDDSDIDVATNGLEVNLLVTSNDLGNIYATLTYEQVCRIHKQMTDNYDPAPWCGYCGAMNKQSCRCGPLADND